MGDKLTSATVEEIKAAKYYGISADSTPNKQLDSSFPNIHVSLRMFLTNPCTNGSAERSFSAHRRIKSKSVLRPTMKEDRLNALSLMAIESRVAKTIDFNSVIELKSLML